MAHAKGKIPFIAITPEAEEDDDHNYLSTADVLTDVETLEIDTKKKIAGQNKNSSKTKLKIKLSNRDDGATDVEDMEASGDEKEPNIVFRENTDSIDDLNLDAGTFKETHKIKSKNSKGKKKLHTQSSTTTESNAQGIYEDLHTELTDLEDWYASDNEQPILHFPEITISTEMLEESINTHISDKVGHIKPSPSVTPNICQSGYGTYKHHEIRSKTVNSTPPPKHSKNNVKDTDYLESDSNDESIKKICTKKIRRRKPKSAGGLTQEIPRISGIKLRVESSAVAYDSDNEREIVPSQKRSYKGHVECLIPDRDDGALTEAEIFEENARPSDRESSEDSTALNSKIDEMQGSCSILKEEHVARHTKIKNDNMYNTDVDDYQTDSAVGDSDELLEKHIGTDDESYNIKFIKQYSQCNSNSRANLTLPKSEEEGHTDVELIDSSAEERDSIEIPVAIVRQRQNENTTDDESLSGIDKFYKIKTYPDIPLPAPFRKAISVREAQMGQPLVTVTPIDETHVMGLNITFNEEEEEATNEESLSDTEALLYVETLSRGPTPELSIFDGGFEEATESIKLYRSEAKSGSSSIVEAITDTEDLFISTDRSRKKQRNKYLSTLTVGRTEINSKTDTEDLYMSDEEQGHHRIAYHRDSTGDVTDVENIAMSDDECLTEQIDLMRALSTTPIYMREMGEETMLAREGLGPFSTIARLDLNKRVSHIRNITASPMLTDTEDLVASADEETLTYSRAETATPIDFRKELDDSSSSKVHAHHTKKIDLEAPEESMYLKGGSFREVHTDVEDMNLSDDDCHECERRKKVSVDILGDDKVLVSMSSLCANLKDCPVPMSFKNGKEWDASEKPSVGSTVFARGTTAVDAVQQGEVSGTWQAAPESVLPRPPAPFKAGHEEGTSEGPAQGPSVQPGTQHRSVADQHQLSEEMKQLLRDMEEDTKK